MGSKTKKLKIVRARKSKPSTKNIKADAKRIERNIERLRELAAHED